MSVSANQVRAASIPIEQARGGALGRDLCMLLALLLRRLVTPEHSYGADQCVYWNARQSPMPRDSFVKLVTSKSTIGGLVGAGPELGSAPRSGLKGASRAMK